MKIIKTLGLAGISAILFFVFGYMAGSSSKEYEYKNKELGIPVLVRNGKDWHPEYQACHPARGDGSCSKLVLDSYERAFAQYKIDFNQLSSALQSARRPVVTTSQFHSSMCTINDGLYGSTNINCFGN